MQITTSQSRGVVVAVLALLGGSLFSVPVHAADARVDGEVTVDLRGRRPRDSEVRQAIRLAEIAALENYVSRSPLKLDSYDKCLRPNINEILKDFVPSSQVQHEEVRASSRQLRVVVKATIRESRLSLALEKCKGATNRRNRISFVFIARQKTEAGGYGVPTVNTGVESAVEQVFLENKFLVTSNSKMEADYPRYSRQRLVKQYASTGGVDWLEAEKAASRMNNDFAVLGTFDIQGATRDSATGMYRVSVSGQGQLVDLQYDAKLAATRRMDEAALGATVEEAANQAFVRAAERIAKRMVDQINSQGYQ